MSSNGGQAGSRDPRRAALQQPPQAQSGSLTAEQAATSRELPSSPSNVGSSRHAMGALPLPDVPQPAASGQQQEKEQQQQQLGAEEQQPLQHWQEQEPIGTQPQPQQAQHMEGLPSGPEEAWQGAADGQGEPWIAEPQPAAAAVESGGASGAGGRAAWPIAFTPKIEAQLRAQHMTSERSRDQIQRCAAAILHALLQGPLETKQLHAAAAPDGMLTDHTFSMACKALGALSLLAGKRPPGAGSGTSRCWSVPPEARAAAKAVVAAAEASGMLVGVVGAAAAAAGGPEVLEGEETEPAAAAEGAWVDADGRQLADADVLLIAGAANGSRGGCSNDQEGSEAEEEDGQDSTEQLLSLTWPLPLPRQLSRLHKRLLIAGTGQQAQRWAAAMLHALQGNPLPSQQLANEAASVLGEHAFDLARDGGSSPHSLARKLLKGSGLVETSRQPGTTALLWSLAPGPEVAAAAARVVAAAQAEGAFGPARAAGAAPEAAAEAAAGQGTKRQRSGKKDKAGAATGNPSRPAKPAAKRKQPAVGGAELVGRSIDVHWNDGSAKYRGTVTAYDAATGLHTILYEDGEVLSHDLSKVLHELLPPATQPVEVAPSKRSRGGAPATHAAPALGTAAPSGRAKGVKRQKQQQAGPAQAAGGKQAGEEAAAAVQPASPTAPLGGESNAVGGTAAGATGAARQLPPPDNPQVKALLAEAANKNAAVPIVERVLELASWAGVSVDQGADFGEAFLGLPPAARLFWYRRLWQAASQQDAQGVWQLMVGDGAPGRGRQLGGTA